MTKPRIARKGPRALTTKGETTKGYVPVHSTDATVFLAAGFISPQTSESNTKTPADTSIIISTAPVPAALLDRARGTREFGFALLAEVHVAKDGVEQPSPGVFVVDSPIPIAHVASLNFRTREELDEFRARAGSYGDVPIDACTLNVAPALFGELGTGELFAFPETKKGPPFPIFPRMAKIGGSIASYLTAARNLPEVGALGWLRQALTAADLRPTLAGVLGNLATAMRGSDGADTRLIEEVGNILESADPGAGFRRQEFLNDLATRATASGDEKFASYVNRFVKHAEDVAAAKRDLADDAFAESDGKIQVRALLLFILNPEPDRLLVAPRRIKVLGSRVFCLASAIAGGFGGLGRLPASTKAPNRQAFAGLTLLSSQLVRNHKVTLEGQLRWDAKGTRHDVLVIEGYEIAHTEAPPPQTLVSAHEFASHLGLGPKFLAESGELETHPGKYDFPIVLRVAHAPTVPLVDGLRASAWLAFGATLKRLGECANLVQERVDDTGTFARVFGAGNRRGIEIFATCPNLQLSEVALGTLIAAVGDAAMSVRQQLADTSTSAEKPSGSKDRVPAHKPESEIK